MGKIVPTQDSPSWAPLINPQEPALISIRYNGRMTESNPRHQLGKLMTGSYGRHRPCPDRWDGELTAVKLALARGHRWLAMLESSEVKSLRELARGGGQQLREPYGQPDHSSPGHRRGGPRRDPGAGSNAVRSGGWPAGDVGRAVAAACLTDVLGCLGKHCDFACIVYP